MSASCIKKNGNVYDLFIKSRLKMSATVAYLSAAICVLSLLCKYYSEAQASANVKCDDQNYKCKLNIKKNYFVNTFFQKATLSTVAICTIIGALIGYWLAYATVSCESFVDKVKNLSIVQELKNL